MAAKKLESLYQTVETESIVSASDGRDLILMMYDAAIDAVRRANIQLTRDDAPAASESISRAMKIVYGLKDTLNQNAGGSVAQHLSDFYSYTLRNLVRANATRSQELLTESEALLGQVREAWATINPDGPKSVGKRLISISA
jgi:flagellar secretion chaperone FliS